MSVVQPLSAPASSNMAEPPSQTVTSTNTQFVVPIYSRLNVEATASLNVVQQEVVSMVYDLSFNYACQDDSESAALLNGFELSQDGDNLSVKMVGAVGEATALAFQTQLKKVIDDASGTNVPVDNYTSPQYPTLADTLYDNALKYFKNIYGDDVANILQTDWSLTVKVNSAAGAENMWNDLKANEPACLLLAEQIPNSTYMVYVDASENMLTNALPLKNDDVLVFLFNVTTQTIARNINNVQAQGTMAAALANTSGGPNYKDNGGTMSTLSETSNPMSGWVGSLSGDAQASNLVSGSIADVSDNWQTVNNLAPSFSFSTLIAAFYVTVHGSGITGNGALSAVPGSNNGGDGVRGLRAVSTGSYSETRTSSPDVVGSESYTLSSGDEISGSTA